MVLNVTVPVPASHLASRFSLYQMPSFVRLPAAAASTFEPMVQTELPKVMNECAPSMTAHPSTFHTDVSAYRAVSV